MLKLVSCLFLCGMVSAAMAACFFGRLSPGTDGGSPVCEYLGFKLRQGSRFQTSDCMNCTCDSSGLRCCGFGAALVSVQHLPHYCEWAINGCEARAVLKADPARDC